MTAVNINDSNATVGFDTSYLFIQSRWILSFAQVCPLILPSPFFVRNMSDFIAPLRSWIVIFFTSIGLKRVLSFSCLTSDHRAFNPLLPNFLTPFIKLYFWANSWPKIMASYFVYSIVYSFSSIVFVIKLLMRYLFPPIVDSNLWIGVAWCVDLLTDFVIYSWLICYGIFSSSVSTPAIKIPSFSNSCNSYLSIYSTYVISSFMVASFSSL